MVPWCPACLVIYTTQEPFFSLWPMRRLQLRLLREGFQWMPPNPEGSLLTQDTARTQPGPSQSKQFFANHSLSLDLAFTSK